MAKKKSGASKGNLGIQSLDSEFEEVQKCCEDNMNRVRDSDQLIKENLSLRVQVLRLQCERRLIEEKSPNNIAAARATLAKITDLERQLEACGCVVLSSQVDEKQSNGGSRISLSGCPIKLECVEEFEESAAQNGKGAQRNGSPEEPPVNVVELSGTQNVSERLKLVKKSTKRSKAKKSKGGPEAKPCGTDELSERVEVRCAHEFPTVIGIRSPTLRSRLSRPCESPYCHNKNEIREKGLIDVEHQDDSRRKRLRQEEDALERERELLRLDRLRLEEERRRIQQQRQELAEALNAHGNHKQYSSLTRALERCRSVSPNRRSPRDSDPFRQPFFDENNPKRYCGNRHSVVSDMLEISSSKRFHELCGRDHYHYELPCDCCDCYWERHTVRRTPLFGTSRSAYEFGPNSNEAVESRWKHSGIGEKTRVELGHGFTDHIY
uniref:Coiled-coil domain-containing protein 9 n=2 Tax=Haemonchus contortus TaxID=6289 RepID=A0A7I4YIS5_HAECO